MTAPRWRSWTTIRDLVSGIVTRLPGRPNLADHIPHGPGPLPGTPYDGPPIEAPPDATHLPDDGRTL